MIYTQPFHLEDEPWRDHAACKGYPVDWWFPEKGGNHHSGYRARRICGSCPVREECQDYGIARNEPGIWGGLNIKERRRVRQAGRQVLTVLVCQWCRDIFVRPTEAHVRYLYCSDRCRKNASYRRTQYGPPQLIELEED